MALADHSDFELEEGYVLRHRIGGLTYPSSVEFSPDGEIFIAEAGFTYPYVYSPARVLRLSGEATDVIAEGFHGPLIGLHWYDDGFLATHCGRLTRVTLEGRKQDLITDLPSFGDHHTNHIVIDGDDVYFGQGTVTNSAVVGPENLYEYGWLISRRKGHDVPPFDVVLSGANFRSRNAFNPLAHTETGPFLPFGETCTPGQVIKGELKANGVIYRSHPDGSELAVHAWGLRNPYALARDPKGRLLTIVQGEDNRGSRGFEEAPDSLFAVREAAWYGWPDFSGGKPAHEFMDTVDTENPKGFLLADHPSQPEQPLHLFEPHTAAVSIDFSRHGGFGFPEQAFVAQFGAGAPLTSGGKMMTRGHKIVRLDMNSFKEEDFFVSKSYSGPQRPVQAKFSPDGRSLFIVDHGYMGVPQSGGLYEITRE